jgi:hypothetical protein
MTTLQDAATRNTGDDNSPARGISVGDIRAWRKQQKELLVGIIRDQIKYSETKTLLDTAQRELATLQEQHAADVRQLQYVELKLREAVE